MTLRYLLIQHTLKGNVNPREGRWGISHMYAEGVGWA